MPQEHLGAARELVDLRSFTSLVAVLGGAKPAMRGTCSGEQAGAILELARALGLGAEISSYALQVEQACGGVMHGWRPAEPGESPESDLRHFYIGADALAARLACAFGDSDPVRLGHMLGYPECCIQFFAAREAVWEPGRPFDLVPDVAPPTTGRHCSLLNFACRHFGYALIGHFPCRWDCEASLGVAEGVLAAVLTHVPELAAAILDCLETDIVYALPHVIAVKEAHWHGGRLALQGVRHWRVPTLELDEVEFAGRSLHLLLMGKEIATVDEWTWLPFASGRGVEGE
jgi:hypothetical protein